MMLTKPRFSFFPLSAFLLLLGAVAPGCGAATIEDVCNKCGATGAKLTDCNDKGTALQTKATKAGCDSEFQAFVDCADEKATCDGEEVNAEKVCDAELNALAACGVNN